MEKLIINNFAGLKEIEIELNEINLFLGPQASGKSVIAKLIYFFKSFFIDIRQGIIEGKSKKEIDEDFKLKFKSYFPMEAWPENDFRIIYSILKETIEINKKNKSFTLNYSSEFNNLIKDAKEEYKKDKEKLFIGGDYSDISLLNNFYGKYRYLISKKLSGNTICDQIFIPAGRSFFSNIQSNIFTILNTKKAIDTFLIQFGSIYENFKRINYSDITMWDNINGGHLSSDHKTDLKEAEALINEVLNGMYFRENEKDYLIHDDKRRVNLLYASSGQQEILPLLIILKVLLLTPVSLSEKRTIVYIEEPEAHLFPNSQRNIVKLLARIFNSKAENSFQFIITTHSPYILSSFNNLMYAGNLEKSKKNEVTKIISSSEIIKPYNVSAYSVSANGNLESVIDVETKLISQNTLDNVSNEISIEFGKLLDLDY